MQYDYKLSGRQLMVAAVLIVDKRIPEQGVAMSTLRRPSWLLVALGGLALLAGCTTAAPTPTPTPAPPIAIGGSDSVYPLAKALATEFAKTRRVEFRYAPESETLGGFTGVGDGSLNIGLASREATPDEQAQYQLRVHPLVKDGLVFAVSAPVELTGLTKQQVMDIYSGKVSNWKELGGPDAAIIALSRPSKTSPTQMLAKLFWGSDFKMGPTVTEMFTPKDMASTLPNTPGAIGYISLADIISQMLPVKMLGLDGVAPTTENVVSGKYPLFRPFVMVTKGEPTGTVKEFVDFARSEEGGKVAVAMGYVLIK